MSYCPSVTTVMTTPDEVFDDPVPHANGVLPCDFVGLLSCNAEFQLNDINAWIAHNIGHLADNLPQRVQCWYCDEQVFDARHRHGDPHANRANYIDRMYHIHDHIVREGRSVYGIRPDYHMLEHLHRHGLIPPQQYRRAREWLEAPRFEGIQHYNYIPPETQRQREMENRVVVQDCRRENRDRHRQHRSRHGH
ncbi:hypothetical protein F4810DRAFT_705916 [Camillea tinctor]|nr:hypothetical protein F4810DRAFT_705916 [Camillea tinctor]